MSIKHYLRSGIFLFLVAIIGAGQAAPVEVIKIGTWNLAPGAGNISSGGPDMSTGQKYVVKIQYDDTSAVLTRDVLTESFTDSGQDMSVIELTGGSNTLDIFVPMEGLDGGTPFIYTQDESTHFPAFVAQPTVNFALGSDVSDSANIIGVEFEGDFVTGANFNVIELFNTVANATDPVNQVGQILNCGDALCSSSNIAIREVNGLADAVSVVVDNSSVIYSAAALAQTTNLNVAQSNDLGAGRSDGETFLDGDWQEGGNPLTGTLQTNGVDIAVDIQNSGLTSTISSATWDVEVTEQMTDLSDTAQVVVDYANASPTSTLSAAATATGYDFALSFDDADLIVEMLFASLVGFEQLFVDVLVDGLTTSLFDDLVNNGAQSLTLAQLAVFGAGAHTLEVIVSDLAGAMSSSAAAFDVGDVSPIPVPPAFILMLTALGFLGVTGFRRRCTP